MDLRKAGIGAILRKYAVPQMIGLVFNSIYFIVDGVFIGRRLGTMALAAAGAAVPVVELAIAASMFLSVGAGVAISAAAGKGDGEGARGAFNQSVLLSLMLAALFVVPGNLFLQPIARLLGAGDAILADTMTYLRYFLSFSPFLILSFTCSTYVRNDGRPALAMWALMAGSLSNVVLDYVFMYPLNMGIAGAALATGLGPVFSVCILLPHFLRRRGTLYFQRVRLRGATVKQILLGGLPAFVTEFSIGFVTLLYNLAIVRAGLGEEGLAAYLVIGYASLICLTVFLGAAQGMQPVVSFLHGAGDRIRIRSLLRATTIFCLVLSVLLYAALAFGGTYFFGIFIGGDAALLHFTGAAARIYFCNLPFAACNLLLISFLQSIQCARSSLAVSLTRTTIPLVLFLLLLPLLWGERGLWLAITCTEALTLVPGAVLWRRAAAGGAPDKTALADTGRGTA